MNYRQSGAFCYVNQLLMDNTSINFAIFYALTNFTFTDFVT